MFNINSNVQLNIKQFIILLVIILSLFLLYNKLYISYYCVPLSKYKTMNRKYKTYIVQLQNKLDESLDKLEQLEQSQMQRPLQNVNQSVNTRDIDINKNQNQNQNQNVTEQFSNNSISSTAELNANSINEAINKILLKQRNNHMSSNNNEINGFDNVWTGSNID